MRFKEAVMKILAPELAREVVTNSRTEGWSQARNRRVNEEIKHLHAEGWSFAAIGQRVGLPRKAVKQRMGYMRAKERAAMAEDHV